MDIDLCKQCYDKGIAYARTHDLSEAVEIDGRTLSIRGDDLNNEDMTCAKIWQMGVRAIAASSLEQAEEAKRAGLLNNMASQKTNLVGSSQNTDGAASNKQDEEIDVVSTEGFASSVFTLVSIVFYIDFIEFALPFSSVLIPILVRVDITIYFKYSDKSSRTALDVCPAVGCRPCSLRNHR